MPEKRTLPVGDEHAPSADRPVYPGRHRGRRLLGVDAYGFAHYRAGDWVEVVRHVAVVDADGAPRDRDAPGREATTPGRDDARDGPHEHRTGGDGRPTVETDLATVHEVPLHLADVSLDEYLRSVGDYLGPVAEQGFRPVEGADPDRWEWLSPYARRWVEAFGEADETAPGDDETAPGDDETAPGDDGPSGDDESVGEAGAGA